MRDGRNAGVHGAGGDQVHVLHHGHGHVEPRVTDNTASLPASLPVMILCCSVLIYMLGSGGTSPFWAGNHTKTQRKILKAKYTTKIPAFERLSEEIKQLIKRSEETNCRSKKVPS